MTTERNEKPKIHKLKTWTDEFWDVSSGKKTFEVRINDRDFKVGDFLELQEWDPVVKEYLGRRIMVRISYILQGKFGLPLNLAVMSIKR